MPCLHPNSTACPAHSCLGAAGEAGQGAVAACKELQQMMDRDYKVRGDTMQKHMRGCLLQPPVTVSEDPDFHSLSLLVGLYTVAACLA